MNSKKKKLFYRIPSVCPPLGFDPHPASIKTRAGGGTAGAHAFPNNTRWGEFLAHMSGDLGDGLLVGSDVLVYMSVFITFPFYHVLYDFASFYCKLYIYI